jgi:hypothetical protein
MARRQQRGLGSRIEAAKNLARTKCSRPHFPTRLFWLYPPDAYGISYQGLNLPELMRGPKPGLCVLSAHLVALLPAIGAKLHPGDGEWLRQVQPTAVIEDSYYFLQAPPVPHWHRLASVPIRNCCAIAHANRSLLAEGHVYGELRLHRVSRCAWHRRFPLQRRFHRRTGKAKGIRLHARPRPDDGPLLIHGQRKHG